MSRFRCFMVMWFLWFRGLLSWWVGLGSVGVDWVGVGGGVGIWIGVRVGGGSWNGGFGLGVEKVRGWEYERESEW